MILKIKKLYEDAIVPTRAYQLDSGLDLYAYIPEEIKLLPFERCVVPCGIAIELPHPCKLGELLIVYEGQVRPKSGLALNQGLSIVNSPGTIDNTYIGELKALVHNTSSDQLVVIKPKQKIAQLVICPVIVPNILVVDELSTTDRQDRGFGSTGE